jgi:hypothetical protein
LVEFPLGNSGLQPVSYMLILNVRIGFKFTDDHDVNSGTVDQSLRGYSMDICELRGDNDTTDTCIRVINLAERMYHASLREKVEITA